VWRLAESRRVGEPPRFVGGGRDDGVALRGHGAMGAVGVVEDDRTDPLGGVSKFRTCPAYCFFQRGGEGSLPGRVGSELG